MSNLDQFKQNGTFRTPFGVPSIVLTVLSILASANVAVAAIRCEAVFTNDSEARQQATLIVQPKLSPFDFINSYLQQPVHVRKDFAHRSLTVQANLLLKTAEPFLQSSISPLKTMVERDINSHGEVTAGTLKTLGSELAFLHTKATSRKSKLALDTEFVFPELLLIPTYKTFDAEGIVTMLSMRIGVLGLLEKPTLADGQLMTPLKFFRHDLGHLDGFMKFVNRVAEQQAQSHGLSFDASKETIFQQLRDLVVELKKKDPAQRKAGFVALFGMIYEFPQSGLLSVLGGPPSSLAEGFEPNSARFFIMSRLNSKKYLAAELPPKVHGHKAVVRFVERGEQVINDILIEMSRR